MTIQWEWEAHLFINKNNTWTSVTEKFVRPEIIYGVAIWFKVQTRSATKIHLHNRFIQAHRSGTYAKTLSCPCLPLQHFPAYFACGRKEGIRRDAIASRNK